MLTHKTGQAAEREHHICSINYFCGAVCLWGMGQEHIVAVAAETVETVVIVGGYKMFAEKYLGRHYDEGF